MGTGSTALKFIRSLATGVLISMLFFYSIHVFGNWEVENYRPDPETTSTILLHNTCAILDNIHTLRPNTDVSGMNDGIDGIKLAGSFMNFFDGHIIGMIILSIVLGSIIFLLRNMRKKKSVTENQETATTNYLILPKSKSCKMRTTLLLLSIFLISQANAQSYKKIHRKAIVVDTHNDILMKAADKGIVFDQDLTGKTDSDLARWKKGGIDVQLFSIYCDGDLKNPFAFANREMDSLDAVVLRNPDKIVKVANYSEMIKAVQQHKIAAMFGVEGGHMIEDDLNKLAVLYKRGARYLTLTHNIAPSWATSAADETTKPGLPHKGLTDFGRQVVQLMNQLGMIIDVSHVGEQTFWDVIKLSGKPIMASHSCVYNLTPHRRNLKDDQIKAIAKNGGVIQLNFNPGFIDSSFGKKEDAFLKKHAAENDSLMKAGMGDFYSMDYLYQKYTDEANAIRPPLSKLIDHIDYIVKLVGVDYVGLGSDFDGINLTPQQLDDVTTYPLITKALVEKGYSKADINKILGGNFLRVLKANEIK